MERTHAHVTTVEAIDLRLPRIRFAEASAHRDPMVALEEEAQLVRDALGFKVSDLLTTTVTYALTMLRAQAWTTDEAGAYLHKRSRETRIARGAVAMRPRQHALTRAERRQVAKLEAQHEAARHGITVAS